MPILAAVAVAILFAVTSIDATRAEPAATPQVSRDAALPTDISSQSRRARAQRDRPRILIYPAPRRLVRRCVDWYAVERRASGPTVVPHMRCWWARG